MILRLLFFCVLATTLINSVAAQQFRATGPTSPTRLPKEKMTGAVRVEFDLVPTQMSFDLPWHFCTVAENGLKFANFAAETYDPRNWDGQGANASFEAGMDKEGRFARAWIEHQSPARIVVRVRYALINSNYEIAHDDLVSDSPYNNGKGDWGEEWFYIYPDGTFLRHMKIHSGLASRSLPTGFFREPPIVVHEFMESVVIGPRGHVPTDDIESSAVTLIKMFGHSHAEVFPAGKAKVIDYSEETGPPKDFGDYRDSNIMLINAKSKFRPFTIGLPYGAKVSPYGWEENEEFPFATWTGYEDPEISYISALGHLVNYWHYRRTEETIEQIYLHGMTSSKEPTEEILPLAWSWIAAPELQMPNARLSPNGSTGDYQNLTYDPTQRAYVVPRSKRGPDSLSFSLKSIYDDEYLHGTMWLVNPAFVIPNWDDQNGKIEVELDGEKLAEGRDFRIGFESQKGSTNLVVWLRKKVDLTPIEEHSVHLKISPE